MKVKKYIYNPDKKGVFRVAVVKKPANKGDNVLMSAVDVDSEDGPITTYADMLITDSGGKVLILKRNSDCKFEPNKWGFPGGKVMPGETTMNGAIRECFEECGITISPESVKSIGEVVNNDNTTSHYFSGTPTNELKLGDEHSDSSWVSSEDLKNYDLILNNQERFKNLIDGKEVLEVIEMSEQEIKGVLYAPVLIPDLKIQRVDENTGEPWLGYFDADTVEKLCFNYWRQSGNTQTNVEHAEENTDGIYPVESWIVSDPETDKSVSIGMPNQVKGTWMMGYKCDSPEVLQMIKDKLINGLSIEGQLDTVEDTESPISKFNSQEMADEKKSLLERAKELLTLMSEVKEEKTPEQIAEEEAKAKAEAEKMAEEALVVVEPSDLEKELETAKATIEQLEKENADLKAQVATFENDATLMSEQVLKVEKAFEDYKTTKMSSVKLDDVPAAKVELVGSNDKHTEFLKETMLKL